MYKVSHAPSSTCTRLLPVSLYIHPAQLVLSCLPPCPPPTSPGFHPLNLPVYFFLQVNLFRVLHPNSSAPPTIPQLYSTENSRRKLPQLVPHHLVRNHNVVVHLAVVHLEDESHHVGQDARRARLRADWRDFLAGEDFDDWEAVEGSRVLEGGGRRGEGSGGRGFGGDPWGFRGAMPFGGRGRGGLRDDVRAWRGVSWVLGGIG